MATGTRAEIIRTGVQIRVWLKGLRNENRNNGWSSDQSMATGTTKTEIRAGVQIRVWLQGLRKQK
jgi:hypothetical protein